MLLTRRIPILAALVVAVSVTATPTLADQDGPLARAIEQIAQQHYAEAIQTLLALTAANPARAEAWYLSGLAHNRLHQWDRAWDALGKAYALGARTPKIHRELGIAAGGRGDYRQCVAFLDGAPADDALAAEAAGLCHARLAQNEKALEKLGRAAELAPAKEARVRLVRAGLLAGMGRTEDAAREVAEGWPEAQGTALEKEYRRAAAALVQEGPQTPVAGILREALEPADSAGGPRRWRFSLTAGVGYNSNVIAASDAVPLPQDISSKDSLFGEFGANAAFDIVQAKRDVLTIGYGFQSNLYKEDLDDADLFDHRLYLDYRRSVTEKLSARLRLSDQYTLVGGDEFRNQIAAWPRLTYRLSNWLIGALGYQYAQSDYLFATSATRDRDAAAQTVFVDAYWRVPDTAVSGRLGYYHSRNDADGEEFDYRANGVVLNVSHPLPFGMSNQITVSRARNDYENPSSFTGFTTAREDTISVARMLVSLPLPVPVANDAKLYLQCQYVKTDSNIVVFEYDQKTCSSGVSLVF